MTSSLAPRELARHSPVSMLNVNYIGKTGKGETREEINELS